jgi:hypothetical protein
MSLHLFSSTIPHTSEFLQSWGHNLFISSKPGCQGSLDIDHLISHLAEMVPQYESVRTEITDVYVDEPRKSVIARSSFFLKAKGVSETVENVRLHLLLLLCWLTQA